LSGVGPERVPLGQLPLHVGRDDARLRAIETGWCRAAVTVCSPRRVEMTDHPDDLRHGARAPSDAFGVDVERRDDGVAWIVLRNPARLNAVRLEMWQALPDAIERLGAEAAVRVVVLRGHGSEAFASGADISEFRTHRKDAASAADYEETTARAFDALL